MRYKNPSKATVNLIACFQGMTIVVADFGLAGIMSINEEQSNGQDQNNNGNGSSHSNLLSARPPPPKKR
jgi:hypothetical protein